MKVEKMEIAIKLNHFQKIHAIAECLNLEPSELVARWLAQEVRRFEPLLHQNTKEEKERNKNELQLQGDGP